jgi:hypothetical protein
MTRTSTQNQGSKTGLATPVRRPVVNEDHPLGSAAATHSPDSFMEVQVPVGSPEGPGSGHQARPPAFEGPETVEEHDQDDEGSEAEEAEGGLSDLDEALSDGASSYGDENPFSGSPNLQGLIRLGQEHCRMSCSTTNKDGAKIPSACGKTVVECQRHAQRRIGGSGSFRFGIGSCSKVPVARGFTGHGIAPPQGVFFSDADLRAFKEAEKEEMSHLVDGMNENSIDKEEMDELARDLRVKFVEPTQKKKSARTKSDPTEELRKAMAAESLGAKKKKAPASPEIWFGMVHRRSSTKWVTRDPTEANSSASKKLSRIDHLFHTKDEAETWLFAGPLKDFEKGSEDEGPPALIPREEIDSDDESIPDLSTKRGKQVARRRDRKRAQKARKRKNEKDKKRTASRPSKKSQRSSTRGGRKKPSRSGGRLRRKRPGHKNDSSSSDPSASDDSDDSSLGSSDKSSSSSSASDYSSSESSNSSSDSSIRNKRRPSARKDRKKRKSKPRPKSDFTKYQNHDRSTGNPKKAFGMSINGTAIDEAICPDQMRVGDQSQMYTAAVDVTSLPGGWNTNKGGSEDLYAETQQLAHLTSTILASTGKARGMEVTDTTWNSMNRHSLGKVKNRDSLFEFVKKLRKSQEAAFNQQSNLVQHFLAKRNYSEKYAEEYCRSSLLARITALSYTYFFALGDAARQSAHDYPDWGAGPAKAMISFHSEKLIEIRQFAVSRKQLILQVYTYLRDAQAKSFYHESMSGALWERISDLTVLSAGQIGGGAAEASRCAWCNNRDFHKLLNIEARKDLCPFRSQTDRAKAREGAKWVVDQKRASPTSDAPELLAKALIKFV